MTIKPSEKSSSPALWANFQSLENNNRHRHPAGNFNHVDDVDRYMEPLVRNMYDEGKVDNQHCYNQNFINNQSQNGDANFSHRWHHRTV